MQISRPQLGIQVVLSQKEKGSHSIVSGIYCRRVLNLMRISSQDISRREAGRSTESISEWSSLKCDYFVS